MMRRSMVAGALAVCAIAGMAGRAEAQAAGVWKGRGYIEVDGGAQASSSDFSSTVPFTLHGEDATFDATYTIKTGAIFAGRAGVRIWKNLAAGVGVTFFSKSGEAQIKGRLPHPFFFSKFREVTGTASGLTREEIAVSPEVSWLVVLSKKMDMMLFAGPAFFTLKQNLATKLQFTEVYPFDTATFTGVESNTVSQSVVGFTAGADVSYLFSKSFGIGGTIRFARASAQLSPAGGPKASINPGGVQAGVGLRLRF